jgi:hypothetical protein
MLNLSVSHVCLVGLVLHALVASKFLLWLLVFLLQYWLQVIYCTSTCDRRKGIYKFWATVLCRCLLFSPTTHIQGRQIFASATICAKCFYLNLRMKYNWKLKRSFLRIILYLFSVINLSRAFSQDNTDIDSRIVIQKQNTAIRSAKVYLDSKFSNKEISQYFIADSIFSIIECDDYKTFFNSKSAYCLPVGFEIAFHVILNRENSWDTLHSHLFLSVDSSFSVLTDSIQDEWLNDFFDAWKKIILNKYKVNYNNVLQFIKEKNMKNYSIDFYYETRPEHSYKFYWFVTEKKKKKKANRSVLYRINPETGAVKVKKLLPLKKAEDVLLH